MITIIIKINTDVNNNKKYWIIIINVFKSNIRVEGGNLTFLFYFYFKLRNRV